MSKRQPVALPSHDTLARLARNAPQSFEALRLELIENCINRAPETIQHRMRQLQFRIDGIRRRSGSPLGTAIKIQRLMWDSFLRLNDELQDFRTQTRPPPSTAAPSIRTAASQQSAQLIAFPAAQRPDPLRRP